MTTFVGDLVYPAEKYMSGGEEKTRWMNCGGVFKSDDGKISVRITGMPTDMSAGQWFRVFPKRDDAHKPRQPKPESGNAQQGGFSDDDIPF